LEVKYERSATLNCVYDLVHALDHGVNPRGGEHGSIPLGNSELMFGLIESHARGGAKVSLPMGDDHGHWRLDRRASEGIGGHAPKFARDESRREDLSLTAEKLEAVLADGEPATATARL
jgi:hypothetical protein